jgi:hypothetical protein
MQSRAQFSNSVADENETDLTFDIALVKLAKNPNPMMDVSG